MNRRQSIRNEGTEVNGWQPVTSPVCIQERDELGSSFRRLQQKHVPGG